MLDFANLLMNFLLQEQQNTDQLESTIEMPKIKRESRQFIVISEDRLISEVQDRPILYDKALKGYRKPAIREGAWQEVANACDSTGT